MGIFAIFIMLLGKLVKQKFLFNICISISSEK